MKCFLLLLASASAFGVPSNHVAQTEEIDNESLQFSNNPIDDLWEKALEFVRLLLKKYEPLEVPDMPPQTFTGDGINLKAIFKHVKVSKADTFTIDHLENHVIGLWGKFNVTVPQLHIEGDYSLQGTVQGRKVETSQDGQFTIDIDQLKTGGYVKLGIEGTYLQMKELDMGYSLSGVKFTENGLKVGGLSDAELNKLLNDSAILTYLQENESFVCTQVSAYVKQIANKIMYKKSMIDLIKWLKDVIDGKIIPTPPSIQ